MQSQNSKPTNNLYAMSLVSSKRPSLHLTPLKGWMNDPNGLWYDQSTGYYHVYYQYSPDLHWSLPITWGHATTNDFVHWEHKQDKLLASRAGEGAFSGSVVVDKYNTSGKFDSIADDNVVSIFTLHTPDRQTQNVTFSKCDLPLSADDSTVVLDINSKQFRDPKVFWHEETEKWIMVVARTQVYEISLYSSKNLVDWKYLSGLKKHGILGYQYECPNLVKIPVFDPVAKEKIGYKWVMFVSINPGGPIGGSFVEYFVGEFNGAEFIPDTNEARIMDHGKDFYAVQVFNNTESEDLVLALGWASNWQYSEMTPDYAWKNCMSIPRKLTLQAHRANDDSLEHLVLYNEPFFGNGAEKRKTTHALHDKSITKTASVFKFKIKWSFKPQRLARGTFTAWSIKVCAPNSESSLIIGFEACSASFFIDRGVLFNQPENYLFNNRSTVDLVPYKIDSHGSQHFSVEGIVDRNILELFFNDGYATATNTFFFECSDFSDIHCSRNEVFDYLDMEKTEYS